MSLRNLFVFLAAFLFSGTAQGWEITTSTFSPGDPVVLQGATATSADPMVVFFTANGGATLDNLELSGNQLVGEIGIAGGPFAGPAEIWWGRRVSLPRTAHKHLGFTYVVKSAESFVALTKEDVGGTGSLLKSTSDTVMAFVVDDDDIDLPIPTVPLPEDYPIIPIRVDIIVDGGGDNTDTTGPGATGKPRLVQSTVHLDVIPDGLSSGGLTHLPDGPGGLGPILDETLGPLGIRVQTNGSKLRFSLVDGQVGRGWALLRLEPGG